MLENVIVYLVSTLHVEWENDYYVGEIDLLRERILESVEQFCLEELKLPYNFDIEEITPDQLKHVNTGDDTFIFLFEGETRKKKNVFVPEELLWLDYDSGEISEGKPKNHPDRPEGVTGWKSK